MANITPQVDAGVNWDV